MGRRRSRRLLCTKSPIHIILRSDLAVGSRVLTRHRAVVDHVTKKAAKAFKIKVYESAICRNHLHFLIRGRRRKQIQNFFRVLAGHIAQQVLQVCPLSEEEKSTPSFSWGQRGCLKNRRVFWSFLIYSRVMTWGSDFRNVKQYIMRNTLEALRLIPYRQRICWSYRYPK